MLQPINAAITALGSYLPPDLLTNADLEKMVDTSDEWIMTRVGIKSRHILKSEKGVSFLATEAAKNMFEEYGIDPLTIDGVIMGTNTTDYDFPTTASMVAHNLGCKNAFSFDLSSACPSFIYGLEVAANFIRSGRYKKILVVGGDKMSSIVDYTDRNTCPLFGDGAGCVLVEPTTEDVGVLDAILRTDGSGAETLIRKAGGSARPTSHDTVDKKEHFVYQEGASVFKHAVVEMSRSCRDIMKRNNLTYDDIAWLVPHQANMRIIEAVGRMLEIPIEKVMINIEMCANTSAGTIPICLDQWKHKLKKGDNLILTSFGAGYTWGAIYLRWAI